LTSGFDADHPRQSALFYALNASSQQGSNRSAYWLSADKQLDGWTSTFFPGVQAKQSVPELFGDSFQNMWIAPAPVLALLAPTIETLEDKDSAITDKNFAKRKIKLRVKSPRLAPKLKISIESIDVLDSKVAGQVYSQTPQPHWYLDSYGLTDEGLIIELTVKAGVPFMVRAIDFTYGFPATVRNPWPTGMMSKPNEFSDTTAVVNVVQFRLN
jgi:hypothetical protein